MILEVKKEYTATLNDLEVRSLLRLFLNLEHNDSQRRWIYSNFPSENIDALDDMFEDLQEKILNVNE